MFAFWVHRKVEHNALFLSVSCHVSFPKTSKSRPTAHRTDLDPAQGASLQLVECFLFLYRDNFGATFLFSLFRSLFLPFFLSLFYVTHTRILFATSK